MRSEKEKPQEIATRTHSRGQDIRSLSLKQNILWNSVGSLVYLGCQWLMTILVVRLSNGFDDAGILSLAMSISNLFTPFAIYRMRAFQVSDTNQQYSTGEYLGFRIITIIIAFAGCMIYASITCQLYSLASIALFLVYKSVEAYIDVLHGADQQVMRMDIVGKSFAIRGVLTIVSFSIVLHFTQNLELALLAIIFTTAPVGFLYDGKRTRVFSSLKPHIQRSKALHLLFNCMPAVLASIACSAALTIPRQYLALDAGDAALGIYASVAAPVAIVQMGGSYIYSPLLGRLAEFYNTGKREGFVALLNKTIIGVLAVSGICSLALSLFGEWGLGLLYGNSITEYAYLLQPMLLCAIATVLLWFLNDLLLAIRKFWSTFIGNVLALIVAIPLTILFVNLFNMNGVSFTGIAAYGLSCVVSFAMLVHAVKKLH